MAPLLALVAITAVWGVTFVQVKDAVELYPVFLFLGIRFAIATLALAPPAARRLRGLGARGIGSGLLLGCCLAGGYALQTVGLHRTSVTSTGFITGLFVPLTPVFAALLFRDRIGVFGWLGTALATVGLAMLADFGLGDLGPDLIVLAAAASFALHIVFTARFAPRYDATALTFLQLATACAVNGAIGLASEPFSVPRGWTVWGALVVTGLFASALGFGVQTWAQRRITATKAALVITMEPVFAGLFGYLLAGDRLGALGIAGCLVILAGILLAEPAAFAEAARLVRRRAHAARSVERPRAGYS